MKECVHERTNDTRSGSGALTAPSSAVPGDDAYFVVSEGDVRKVVEIMDGGLTGSSGLLAMPASLA
jgi:hypothetical protein